MISILQSLSKTIHLSIVLAILLFLGLFFDVPERLGESLLISASKRVIEDDPSLGWRLYVEGESLNINDWLNLFSYKFERDLHGIINIDAWLQLNLHGLGALAQSVAVDSIIAFHKRTDRKSVV